MADFKRNENTMYSIPQRFADEKIGRCPFCKCDKPRWLVKEEWKLLGKNYHFKCPHCGSILMASQEDVTGLSFTTKSFAGQMKKYKGKDNKTIYVKIVNIGLSVKTPDNIILQGEEMALEELKNEVY